MPARVHSRRGVKVQASWRAGAHASNSCTECRCQNLRRDSLVCLPRFPSNVYSNLLHVEFAGRPPFIQALVLIRLRETNLVLGRIVC
jgi:hypothetical protein